jgi:hypothetical protein
MDSFPFPFSLPYSIDFESLRLVIKENCFILRRQDRDYPHFTLFFEKMPGTDFWWPHITLAKNGKDRRIGLAELREEYGQQVEQRLVQTVLPRIDALLRPVPSLEEFTEQGWLVVTPTPEFMTAFYRAMCIEERRWCLDNLEGMDERQPQNLELWSCMLRCAKAPVEFKESRPTSQLQVFRFVENGTEVEHGYLRWHDVQPEPLWFFAPASVSVVDLEQMVTAVFPNFFGDLRLMCNVLDVPMPGVNEPED